MATTWSINLKPQYRIIPLIILIISLASCASMTKKRGEDNGQNYIPVAEKKITVIGTVRQEINSYSILGFPPGLDKTYAVLSWGGNAYDKLLEKAGSMGAHDVINITTDFEDISIFFLFNRRRFIVNGLAIRYVDE